MKTPGFWFRPPTLMAKLLQPLGLLYYKLGQMRAANAVKTTTPLIVVGNVVAGGAGKTPVVLALATLLQQRGLKVHLMAKGYGGKLRGPLRVTEAHTAAEVGDEPLLLAKIAPTFIGHDRGAAYELAAPGADVVISDDGLQSPRLKGDLTLLVLDGVLGFGNGLLIPAGPLREPVDTAFKRIDAVVQLGGTDRPFGQTPVALADFVVHDTDWLRGTRVIAFAGIGQPEKFFATLTTCGASMISAHAFGDHHPYSIAEIEKLLHEAAASNAVLVTTSKDHVRLPPHLRVQVKVVEGALIWRNPDVITRLLEELLARYKAA